MKTAILVIDRQEAMFIVSLDVLVKSAVHSFNYYCGFCFLFLLFLLSFSYFLKLQSLKQDFWVKGDGYFYDFLKIVMNTSYQKCCANLQNPKNLLKFFKDKVGQEKLTRTSLPYLLGLRS